MLKRLILAIALLLPQPLLAAGTINLALTQQLDKDTGKPLAGGKLYFIQAGTVSTPQVAYQDSGLTIPIPGGSVYTLDASGRIPQFFLADGQIKIRLVNKTGIVQFEADNLLVIGASSGGGGGGGSVDPTTIIATGDLKVRYGTGVISGFVRANGRTVGSATSGATERASADTQALFEYLWNADANLAVSTGRGASSSADWTANKTIALPDWSGRALVGLDDMGAGARGVMTSTYFGTATNVLGAGGGFDNQTLLLSQIPSHSHGGVTGFMSANSTHNHQYGLSTINASGGVFPGGGAFQITTPPANTTDVDLNHTHSITAEGGGLPHTIVMPSRLATIYLKL